MAAWRITASPPRYLLKAVRGDIAEQIVATLTPFVNCR
jgi:hypothetical protein